MVTFKQWRKDVLGLTQDKFAEKVKISQPTVANYENGTRKPDLAAYRKILLAFPELDPFVLLKMFFHNNKGD
jgi:predicted transcriptional regulator